MKQNAATGTSENVEFFHRGGELEIVRRWFNDRTIGMTVVTVIVNGFAFTFFTLMGSHSAAEDAFSLFQLARFIFPSVGIFLAYRVAADWLNRTYITVSREEFSVRHRPLPWPGNLTVAVVQIKRLHTDVSRWVTGKGQHRRYTYDVLADRQDGKSMKLVGGFESNSQAARVAQEIARYLGHESKQGAPQIVPEPEDRDTLPDFPPASVPPRQARTVSADPETNIQSVLAIWLFILLWNGVIWGVALMLWDSPRLKNAEVGLVFFAFFALIGFVLFCSVIPATWRFFRQKAARRQDTASRRSGWGVVIALLVIAAGFATILTLGMRMHNEGDARLRQLQTPATWHK